MKATLEFDLNAEFEDLAHKRALNATNAYIALHSVEELFRSLLKYQIDNLSTETVTVVDQLAQDFYKILDRYDIDLNDLE